MITQDTQKKPTKQDKTLNQNTFKKSNFSAWKKEATSRAKANIFPHFLPNALGNFN